MDTNRKPILHTPRRAGGLSVLLTLAALVCLLLAFAATANAETIASGYCGGEGDGTNLTWTLDSEGTLTISGSGPMKNYNSYSAPWRTSEHISILKKLVLSEEITSIGASAFSGCSGFTGSLTIGNSVTTIEASAFSGCNGFTGNLHIPDSVTFIGSSAFYNCSGFNGQLILSDALQEISKYAFASCSKLVGDLYIPDSVISIGRKAFSDCSSLNGQLYIGSSVTTLEFEAFGNCINLHGDLIIPDNVVNMQTGQDYDHVCSPFLNCTGFDGDLVIGSGVNSLDFPIPKGFKGRLILRCPVTSIPSGAFKEIQFTGSLVLPESVTSIGAEAFSGCKQLSGDLVIPNNVTNIGESAFSGCSGFTGSLTIPSGTTSIGNWAFSSCTGLTGKLTIPGGVAAIGKGAFYNCEGFNGPLTIMDGVTTIGDTAFYNCSGFTNDLVLPDSVIEIGSSAFYGCSGFNGRLILSNGLSEIGSSAFSGCGNFNGDLTIPDGVSVINTNTFAYCSGFNGNLTIPDSVTSIGEGAFENCSGFTGTLVIPDSVTAIAVSAFKDCSGFTGSLTIPGSVTTISRWAFKECSNLTDITISDGVEVIDTGAFQYCNSVSTVWIASSVTDIQPNAFFFSGTETKAYFYSDAPSENSSFPSDATLYYISGKAGWTSPKWHGYKTELWDPDAAFFEDGMLAIQIFDGLFSDGTKLSCDKGMYVYSIVSETDRSFMEQLDSITGKYVLVKLDDDEQLLAIRPVTSFVATASAVTSDTITFDGVQYPRWAEEVFWPEFYINHTFLVHLYDGKVISMEQLQPLSGRLNSWDESAGSVTVDNTVYPVNYLVGENFWNEISAQQGQYVGFYLGMDWVFGYGKPYLFRVSPLTGKSFIRLYASSQLMELASGESLDIFCELFRNDAQVEDWNTPAITVSDGSALHVSSYNVINGGIVFKVTGTGTGVSTLTVSDSVSGAYAAIPITVGAERSQTLSYRMDAVPDFKPGVWGDEYTQTNFYNIAGMCINNYRYQRPSTANGKHKVSFDVYNVKYMHGAVDIYDSNGKWIESKKIEKQTGISSISQTFESAFYLVADFADGQAFSYMSSTQSKKTHISIEVPDGGYFTISTNYAQSPGCMLYNAADYIFEAANTAITISTKGIDSIEKVLETSLKDAIAEKAIWDSFMGQMQSNSMKMLQSVSTFSIGASVGAVTQTSVDVLKSIGVDWVSVVKTAVKIDEGALMKILEMGPPGKALTLAFKINKYVDLAAQTKEICRSLNNRIITIHTPDQNSGKTTVQGVSVEAPEGAVESGAVLQVFRVNTGADDETLPEQSSIESYDVYNICFVKDGKETQLHGTVTVRIPKPAGFKGSTCQVWRQESDGSWTPITAVVEENYLVFETDHFSLYAVAASALSAEYLGEELVISGYIPRLPDTFGTALLALYDDSGRLLRVVNADELRSGSKLAVSQRFNDLSNAAFAKLFLLTQEHKPASAAITAELQ